MTNYYKKQIVIFLCFLLWFSTFFVGKLELKRSPKPYNFQVHVVDTDEEVILAKNVKKILFYTSYFHMTDWQFGFGQQPFLDFQCPVSNCYATNNKDLFGTILDFDAVLFHSRDVKDADTDMIQLPDKRRDNQIYVWFSMESPSYDFFPHDQFKDYFNWTMTYRQDSDLYRPYGWVAPRNWTGFYPSQSASKLNWSQNPERSKASFPKPKKRKLVAWLVSNCHTHSQREHYVQELSKHIQIDVYGRCPKLLKSFHQCPSEDDCQDFIQQNYMFYLSFENSVCQDYVTEKFWNYLQGQLVPIVLGGADYDKIAPPHSFINAMNFPNPKELANHLHYLVNNQTAYQEYFRWVPDYTVYDTDPQYLARAMCQLCESLHQSPLKNKVYTDTKDWWVNQGQCQETLPWSQPVYNYQWTELSSWNHFIKDSASKFLHSLRESKVII